MNSKEDEIIKNINSNLLRAQRTDNPISKLEYLLKVVNDSAVFAYISRNRGDSDYTKIYMRQAEIVHKDIGKLLAKIRTEVLE